MINSLSLRYALPLWILAVSFIFTAVEVTHTLSSREEIIRLDQMSQVRSDGNRLVAQSEQLLRDHRPSYIKQQEIRRLFSLYLTDTVTEIHLLDATGKTIVVTALDQSDKVCKHENIASEMRKTVVSGSNTIHVDEAHHRLEGIFAVRMPPKEGELLHNGYGVLVISMSYQEKFSMEYDKTLTLLGFRLTGLAAVVIAIILFIRFRVLDPISKIRNTVHEIDQGNRDLRIGTINAQDELGEISRSINRMLDSLNRQSTEMEELTKSLTRTQSIAKMGNWEWDLLEGSLWWSEGIYPIFGLSKETRPDYEMFLSMVPEEDQASINKRGLDALEKDIPYDVEHRIVPADGSSVRIVRELGEVIRDQEGKAIKMIGTVQDITELALARNELEAYKKQLEAKVEEEITRRRQQESLMIHQSRLAGMGEMIGNIAHQWRQPLNALALIMANLQDSYQYDELTKELMEKMVDKANTLIQKMSSTIDDFRNFFKPESKDKKCFSIRGAIEETLGLVEGGLKSSEIDVFIDVDPELEIIGFKNEFTQVILNLFNNAKDALEENRSSKRHMNISAEDKNGNIIISFADNAGGIPSTVIDRIFDPYFSTKEEGKGTGIGLYMSKIIIEEHHQGNLEVYNGDAGAVFVIRLIKG